jgi:exonuclease 3'-5' domain-containing protein 1
MSRIFLATEIPLFNPEEGIEISSLLTSLEDLDLHVDQSPEFVDTESKVASLLVKLQDLPVKPPFLYIDLEGVNFQDTGAFRFYKSMSFHLTKRIWWTYGACRRGPSYPRLPLAAIIL